MIEGQGDKEKRRQGEAQSTSPGLLVSHSPGLIALLAVLFFGPLLAPLFQAARLPLVAESGALARDLLARYICPTPAKSYALLGFPMAVCARCWGATVGLWAAWLLFRQMTKDERQMPELIPSSFVIRRSSLFTQWFERYCALEWPLRLLLGALPFGLWLAEVGRWPAAPHWVLLLNGAFAGFWAGLFCCSVWLRSARN